MKVSIIIPVYNVEAYIEACLQSVANQTLAEEVECILVDDCGKDESILLAEKFVQSYRGNIVFSIFHHNHNRGLSAARNTGIKAAKGEYIYFLDSDDEIIPNGVELMYDFVINYPGIDIVQGAWGVYTTDKFPLYTQDRRIIKSSFLKYNAPSLSAHNRLIRKALLLENNLFFKEGIIHEDVHWAFFLSKYVESMALCNAETYFHRYNPDSITHKINRENEIKAFSTIIEDFSRNVDDFLGGDQKGLIYEILSETRR